MNERDCPCQSGETYTDCCKPLHDGIAAQTAIELMRSRYSAYVLENTKHLYRSWHPDTRPSLQLSRQEPKVDWMGLQIVSAEQGKENDQEGWVSFVALWMEHGRVQSMNERSYFSRVEKKWVYVSGEIIQSQPGLPL